MTTRHLRVLMVRLAADHLRRLSAEAAERGLSIDTLVLQKLFDPAPTAAPKTHTTDSDMLAATAALKNVPLSDAIRIVEDLASQEKLYYCSECNRFYRPSRRPARSRNHYCQKCGRKAAVREAVRRYRLKKLQQRDTPHENKTL